MDHAKGDKKTGVTFRDHMDATFEDVQIAKIKRVIADAEAGRFVPDEEMEAFFKKWAEEAD